MKLTNLYIDELCNQKNIQIYELGLIIFTYGHDGVSGSDGQDISTRKYTGAKSL